MKLARVQTKRLPQPPADEKEKNKVILAIETSCDETAAAVLRYAVQDDWPQVTTLSSVINSQIKLHSKFGGVVPEAAARAHIKFIRPVVERALYQGGTNLADVDCIAVTAGPGLAPSLIVGVEFAKGLAFGAKKPLLPVNHMLGHLYSPFQPTVSGKQPRKDLFPMIALIVSGGHTILALLTDRDHYRILGQTVDDAAGEAFDKVAKLLGLPYPGGPQVSRLAARAAAPVEFPRPMLNSKNYNFSFSGLKTAVLYHIQSLPTKHLALGAKQNICAGFEQAAVDVLAGKTIRAAAELGARSISLSGGVSANAALRRRLAADCRQQGLKFFVPPAGLSTDNAEMIGLAAAFLLARGKRPVPPQRVAADPNLAL